MIFIFHLVLILLSFLISGYIIYWRYFRFNRTQLLNKIVKNHLNRIKERMSDDRYIDYEYEIGHLSKIDNEIIEKLMKILINKGFTAFLNHKSDGWTYINIK